VSLIGEESYLLQTFCIRSMNPSGLRKPDSGVDESYRGGFDEAEELGGTDPAQEQSGLSVTAFCREHGFSDPTFYNWRKRLSESEPVRFALAETGRSGAKEPAAVDLFLASGDRLRIVPGVDAATLRTVLSVLRERA